MLRLWRRLTASRAPYVCHFCGQASVLVPPYGTSSRSQPVSTEAGTHISCGTPARWFCSACGCWNHQDLDGHTLDVWERAMWDTSANPDGFASASADDSAAPCVFCRTCLTNQTLVTNLLANYLSEHDDDDTDAARLEALPAYKHSLEQRYPMACEACARKASARIQAVDRQVQQQLLGTWVQPLGARHDPGEGVDADAYHAQVAFWQWCRRHWYVVQAATLAWGVLCLQPHRSSFTWALGALALMPTAYDPGWHDAATIRVRGAQPIESGATCWKVRRHG